jgi:UDP-glucose 6-dehydrogenase
MKISCINAVAHMCESVGADVRQVCASIGADRRFDPRFLNPGIGYGGSCFPKDLTAFRAGARECGCDSRLLDEVINISEDQQLVSCARFARRSGRYGASVSLSSVWPSRAAPMTSASLPRSQSLRCC